MNMRAMVEGAITIEIGLEVESTVMTGTMAVVVAVNATVEDKGTYEEKGRGINVSTISTHSKLIEVTPMSLPLGLYTRQIRLTRNESGLPPTA